MGIYKDTLNYLSRLKITIPLDDSWSIKLNLNNEQHKLSSVTL